MPGGGAAVFRGLPRFPEDAFFIASSATTVCDLDLCRGASGRRARLPLFFIIPNFCRRTKEDCYTGGVSLANVSSLAKAEIR